MKIKKNIFWTADRSRIVEEGDPSAAYIMAFAGDEVDENIYELPGTRGKKKTATEDKAVRSSTARKKK